MAICKLSQIKELYEAGSGVVEIARIMEIGRSTVHRHLKRMGITRSTKEAGRLRRTSNLSCEDLDNIKTLYLSGIGTTILARRFAITSSALRRELIEAGIKTRSVKEAGKFRGGPLCWATTHSGPKHPAWRGGKRKIAEGYIEVKIPSDDFFLPMVKKGGYVLEHRLVMAKYMKRCLEPWEIVHHRNGIKDDNRIENLELLPVAHKHIAITRMQQHIKKLEHRISNLEAKMDDRGKEIRLLRWQIKEREVIRA